MRTAWRIGLAFIFVFGLVVMAAPATARAQEEDPEYRRSFEAGIRLLTDKKYDESIAAFRRCIEIAPEVPTAYYNIACGYSLKGDKDKAFEWLERAIEKGFTDVQHMDQDGDLDPIRKDPRYKDAVALARGERPARVAPGALVTLEGEPASLEKLKGKVVILDFWRTWCGPCKAEIPHFIELQREYGDAGLAIVGVSDEPADLQEKFADQLKVNYTLLLQKGDLPAPFDRVDVFPTTFVLDREGKVVHKFVGLRPKKTFEDAIRPLLGVDATGPTTPPTARPEPKKEPRGRLF